MQNDVTYIAMILGLFALMFGLIWACDRIIGSDEQAFEEQGAEPQADGAGADGEAVAA